MKTTTYIIDKAPDGTPIHAICLTNSNGASVRLTNYGARLLEVRVPDRDNRLDNVLVTPDDILNDTFYMGATIGRFANRIGSAKIVIDGTTYQLDKNDGRNTNHGGFAGFDRRAWQWEEIEGGVRFTLVSPDGEGGYPGTETVSVEYRWDEGNRLTIHYHGTTDSATYLNMTNHAYFDLSCNNGKQKGAIYRHELLINSHKILDTTPDFIPTGKKVFVDGTPFDFTIAKAIGTDIHADNEQLRWNRGYNHCYVLKEAKSDTIVDAATLHDPDSGRWLKVQTDLPAILLYTAGYYPTPDCAVCLEAQYYPDTPSHPDFPSCLLRPDEIYNHTTIFTFGCEKL